MSGVRDAFRHYGLEKVADDLYDKPSGWAHAAVPGVPLLAGAALTARGALRGSPSEWGQSLMGLGALAALPALKAYADKQRPYAAEQILKRPAPTTDDERRELQTLMQQADPEMVQKLHARFSQQKTASEPWQRFLRGTGEGAVAGAGVGAITGALAGDPNESTWDRMKSYGATGATLGGTVSALGGPTASEGARNLIEYLKQEFARRRSGEPMNPYISDR